VQGKFEVCIFGVGPAGTAVAFATYLRRSISRRSRSTIHEEMGSAVRFNNHCVSLGYNECGIALSLLH